MKVSSDAAAGSLAAKARTVLEIDPAGKKQAERHVADQAPANGIVDMFPQLLDKRRLALGGCGILGLDRKAPVARLPRRCRCPDRSVRQEPPGSFRAPRTDRVGRRDVTVGEEFLQGAAVERAVDLRMLDQRRQLGGEGKEIPGRAT